MTKTFLSILGAVLALLGLILTITPLPGSTIVLATGLALLLCSSAYATRCLRKLRSRIQAIDSGIAWLEDRTGDTIGGALRRSKPVDRSVGE